MSKYIGQEADEARPLLPPCADSHDVHTMLSILGGCLWNYIDAKEACG